MSSRPAKKRFQALDLLRGFFIVTIICDHLSRWPSLFGVLSGKALLWVTAAEGFVIISGLLVGYIRGYKSKAVAFKEVCFKLWRRALTLYLWAIIGSIVYTAYIWYVPLVGGAPGMPIDKGDWSTLVFESITLNYTFLWVYFLKLYAIFIAAAPLAIWLLRKGLAWAVVLLSFGILALGWATNNEVLQWQFIFFVPVAAGYYMPNIQKWWQQRSPARRIALASTIIVATALTVVMSYIGVFQPAVSQTLNDITASLFAKDSISLFRALTAFLWFTAFVLIFVYLEKYIKRFFGWLLLPIGTHSLTAYIVHGAAIIVVSSVFAATDNFVVNTLLGIFAILMVLGIVKIPGINRVIPR